MVVWDRTIARKFGDEPWLTKRYAAGACACNSAISSS